MDTSSTTTNGATTSGAISTDPLIEDLHEALRSARATLRWKLEGLSEYDRRWPRTRTGTNLLGLVKHLTLVEVLFSFSMGRDLDDPPSWCVYGTEESHFLALPHQSTEHVLDQYARAAANTDAVVATTRADAPGTAPWGEPTTLHRALVHLLVETQRHLGHVDVVRESLDGLVGETRESDGVFSTAESWEAEYAVVEHAAEPWRAGPGAASQDG